MKRFYKNLAITIGLLLAVAVGSVFAASPNSINYQGRMTDGAGDPVPDGPVLVKFVMYDAPVAGTILWDAGFQNITTVNGLFSYELGSNVAFPSNLFADTVRWLGITIGVDAELAPRTRITSSAYAKQSIISDTAGIAATVFDNSITGVKIVDGTIDSTDIANQGIGANNYGFGSISGSHIADGSLTGLDIADGTINSLDILNNSIGSADIFDNSLTANDLAASSVGTSEVADNSLTANDLAANSVGASEIATGAVGTSEIADNAVISSKIANGTILGSDIATGTITGIDIASNTITAADIAAGGVGSSEIADNSVLDTDILDEPGIASQQTNPGTVFTTTMTDIETVQITIPTSGYIVVTGRCYLRISGATTQNYIQTQIDEIAGGTLITPHSTKCGMALFPSAGNFYYNAAATRTYFKGAGTYTFRLEGLKTFGTHSVSAFNALVSAVFYPTSYGPTTTTVSSITDAPPGSRAIQVIVDEDPTVTETMYEVDLRALEIKARKAEEAALKAKLELEEARNQQSE